MKNLSRILARYACQSHFKVLPLSVQHETVRAFVNYIGCAAGGALESDVHLMIQFLSEFNGNTHTGLIGRSERLDMLNAAFINSMSSGALAFNDTHFASVAHPTSPVAASLLSLCSKHEIDGESFMIALCLGIEIQCRIGNILALPPAKSSVGLSIQGLVGTIGAAVGAGKFLKLEEEQMCIAIGLAANQSAGLRQAQSTMGSHFTPGHAARCGLTAALLAQKGFECSDNMLEGPKGFGYSFAMNPNFEVAVNELGKTFELTSLAYKPYPSGVVIHPIIDGCLEIVKNPIFKSDQIETIKLRLNPLAGKLTDLPHPKDRGQALVSLQHWAAVTLMNGQAGIAEVTDETVKDPSVVNLRQKVTYDNDESMGVEAAFVSVRLKNGKVLDSLIRHCKGSALRPLSDEDISEKTLAQLKMVYSHQQAEKILQSAWAISSTHKMSDFCKILFI